MYFGKHMDPINYFKKVWKTTPKLWSKTKNGSCDFFEFMSKIDLGIFYDLIYNPFPIN